MLEAERVLDEKLPSDSPVAPAAAGDDGIGDGGVGNSAPNYQLQMELSTALARYEVDQNGAIPHPKFYPVI